MHHSSLLITSHHYPLPPITTPQDGRVVQPHEVLGPASPGECLLNLDRPQYNAVTRPFYDRYMTVT